MLKYSDFMIWRYGDCCLIHHIWTYFGVCGDFTDICKTLPALFIIKPDFLNLLMCLFVRFWLQAAALWPSSEVRGQTGSTGAAGEKIQGSSHIKHIIILWNIMNYSSERQCWPSLWWISLRHIAGQQRVGRLVLGQRLPRRGEAGHRWPDGARGDVPYPVS